MQNKKTDILPEKGTVGRNRKGGLADKIKAGCADACNNQPLCKCGMGFKLIRLTAVKRIRHPSINVDDADVLQFLL
jgi:hypothetical protein